MGALAIAAVGLAVSAGTAYAGYQQNEEAANVNAQREGESKKDYETRLKAAAKGARQLTEQYDDLVKERPNLSWESFVRDKLKSINDPYARQVYTNAKSEDFEKLREFGKAATLDNVDNLKAVADKLSNGRFNQIVDERDNLILNNDAASRFARTYELAAPIRNDASTVKYDDKGNLIEGQRADKQAFSIANEVQTAVDQERKQDLRQLETDRITAAQSQTEKAKSFTSFFDPVGYATAAESERSALSSGYQQLDEQKSFALYQMFAGQAAGITAAQPKYENTSVGNELIASGVKSGTGALTDYYKSTQKPSSGNTYS